MGRSFIRAGIVYCLLLGINSKLMPQRLGIPFVTAYPKTSYGYGTHNWDIEQSASGLLYFANNDGLMEFDGANWRLFQLPNKTIVRSIQIDSSAIYVGGQNEFGVFLPDLANRWRFQSLKSGISEPYRDFEDVWNIVQVQDTVYFRASERIYVTYDNKWAIIDNKAFQFLGSLGNQVFVQDVEGQLYELEQFDLRRIDHTNALLGTEISGLAALDSSILIATLKHGLFELDGLECSSWKVKNREQLQFINRIVALENGDIAIGTAFEGVLLVDKTGQVKFEVGIEDGLPNNKVICEFVDRNQNLWLGHDSGISMLETNSPFSRIYPNGQFDGAGYDVKIFNDNIYFGTGSGLYVTEWGTDGADPEFRLVQNTNGQVWGLDLVEDQLLLSHHYGGLLVNGAFAKPFFNAAGNWLFQQDLKNPEILISGNYKGVSLFDASTLQNLEEIEGLNESCRFIEQDAAGNYWVSHPYKGVYRISHGRNKDKTEVQLFGPEHGLPSFLHNHVFKINDEILICAEKGVFVFDSISQSFQPYPPIMDFLGNDIKIRRLFEAPNGNIWYITEQEIGVLEIEEKGLTRSIRKRMFPGLKSRMNGGWEKIYPYDDDHIFLTTIDGFLHYNRSFQSSKPYHFQIVPGEMYINKDSVLYIQHLEDPLRLKYSENALQFNVGATDYLQNNSLQFQFFLEGFDDGWTPLSALRSKEYTNLSPGAYTLQVRAFNEEGGVTNTFRLPFEILKPWYASYAALLGYLLLVVVGIYLLSARARRRYRALEQKVDSTVKLSKEEIQRLETEKVQAELDHKKRELVSSTMHLIQKNETLSDITEQLVDIRRKTKDTTTKERLMKLIRLLKKEEIADDGWEQLMYHFNETHDGFFDKLKAEFPSLTPKDLRLCAYLKMNLNTKEMASLMNVSVRGVEASRYRLRKKLDLTSDENLTEFFMAF